MQNSKKLLNKLNADDDERFLQDTDYINLENCLIGQNEYSKNFAVQNIPSTELLFYYTSGLNSLGTAVDYNKKRMVWFDHNEDEGIDTIFIWYIETRTAYRVLVSTQVEGGFNLSLDYRVDRNARIVDDLLFWTDNNNEPRCINIERGIKLNQPSFVTNVEPYTAPIPYTSSTVIVRPPIYQLTATKTIDSGFNNNFIALHSYQFYYRYWYKDYQYSVLSTYSLLIPYNGADETFNAIIVKMPFTEDIPDEVQQVDFCYRDGNYGNSFVIRSWNKSNPYDLMAIESHNANAVQLGLTFYDNISGVAIDAITANTPFDSVALKAKTLEVAKNRLFLGNVLKGYDSPAYTSLQVEIGEYDTGGGGTYTADWKYFYLTAVQNSGMGSIQVQYFYAYVSSLPTTSYYYSAYQSASPPASVNSDDADTSWQTETQLAADIQRNTAPPFGYHWQTPGFTFFTTGATTDLIFAVDLNGLQFFKSSSLYNVSIAFYDRYRRKCGVVNDVAQISIPDRTSDQTAFATTINWSLSNADAINEIPDWAYYYQIIITKNLTTRFFEQIFIIDTNYANKEQDGTYTYTGSYDETRYAIALDITPLYRYGLGYTFNDGDLCRIYFSDGTNIVVPVLGVDGNNVLVQPQDIGSLGAGTSFLIELYTPYRASTTEGFYETGDMMNVINPTEDTRQYETTTGSINGDAYAIERDKGTSGTELYFVEAMSPNDKVWQIWQMDRGWVNFYDTIGQQQKETNIDWSDTYIHGSKTNGLNKFEPLNTKDIGNSSGSIQKLQLTNKMEESGTVILVITDTDTLSAYLGEIQLYNAATVEGLITTNDVIGSINALQNGQGTLNPESVVEYNGTVWWINILKGVVAQYAANGVINISDFKMRRYFDRFSKRYMYLGKDGVEALCGFSHISACVDISNNLYMLTLPQTEVNAVVSGIPVGFAQPLPSYDSLPNYASSIQNRFDIYDGQPKTMCYDYVQNKWVGAFQWLPECMEYFGNKLFGFKDGFLYLHNESTSSYNTIYGVQYPQRLCFTCNIPPSEVKRILNIALESKQIPNFTVLYTNYPEIQITDLTEDDYDNQEGVMYAKFYRDRLSPNTSGNVIDKLYQGDVVIGAIGYIMLEFEVYDEQLSLNLTNIGFTLSKGQSNILNITK